MYFVWGSFALFLFKLQVTAVKLSMWWLAMVAVAGVSMRVGLGVGGCAVLVCKQHQKLFLGYPERIWPQRY